MTAPAIAWAPSHTPGVHHARVGAFTLSTSGLSWRITATNRHSVRTVEIAQGRADYDPRHDAVEALVKICTETLKELGQ